MLPYNLILVRHGQSEHNLANERSRHGDHSDFTADFLNRHSAHMRLTEKGKVQARAAGTWLKEHGLDHFDRYYVSEYTRAMETAALLELPAATWYTDYQLRERDHGLADIVSHNVREEEFREYGRLRKIHLFYAPWPDGESMADVCNRLRNNIVSTLHRECSDKNVLIVSHGDIMRALRVIFERMSADRYHDIDQNEPKEYKIGNGQVIHYTRVDPANPKNILPYFGWVRSTNPYDPAYAGHDWRPIVREQLTNTDLLTRVERSTCLVRE